MSVRSSPGADSGKRSSLPDDRRERLIDAALELFARQGYDATTADQICVQAGVPQGDFARFFATPEAVLISIVDDMSAWTAAALKDMNRGANPEQALLSASTAMVTAIVQGRGAVPLDRLLAMARIVNTTRNLHRTVSAARKRVIAPALAEWMGVDRDDRRLQRALTMWSAVTASTYAGSGHRSEYDKPQRGNRLQRRMIEDLSQSFREVTGQDPDHSV